MTAGTGRDDQNTTVRIGKGGQEIGRQECSDWTADTGQSGQDIRERPDSDKLVRTVRPDRSAWTDREDSMART
jgi:hypothetical protein